MDLRNDGLQHITPFILWNSIPKEQPLFLHYLLPGEVQFTVEVSGRSAQEIVMSSEAVSVVSGSVSGPSAWATVAVVPITASAIASIVNIVLCIFIFLVCL